MNKWINKQINIYTIYIYVCMHAIDSPSSSSSLLRGDTLSLFIPELNYQREPSKAFIDQDLTNHPTDFNWLRFYVQIFGGIYETNSETGLSNLRYLDLGIGKDNHHSSGFCSELLRWERLHLFPGLVYVFLEGFPIKLWLAGPNSKDQNI